MPHMAWVGFPPNPPKPGRPYGEANGSGPFRIGIGTLIAVV
jgi:hypothetical protein